MGSEIGKLIDLEFLQTKVNEARTAGKRVVVFFSRDMVYFENFMPVADWVEEDIDSCAVIRVDAVIHAPIAARRRPDNVYCLLGDGISELKGVDVFCSSFLRDFPEGAITINFHHDVLEIAPPFIYDYYLMPSRFSQSAIFDYMMDENLSPLLCEKQKMAFVRFGYLRIDNLIKRSYSSFPEFLDHVVVFFSVPYNDPSENCLLYPNHHVDLIEELKRAIPGKIYLKFHPNRDFVNPDFIKRHYAGDERVAFLEDSNSSEENFRIISTSRFICTDLSGTAYTNSFIHRKPVLFYSPFEVGVENKLLFGQNLMNVGVDQKYIEMREIVGGVCRNRSEVPRVVSMLEARRDDYVRSIEKCVFSGLFNTGCLREFSRKMFTAIICGEPVGDSIIVEGGRIVGVAGGVSSLDQRFEQYLKFKHRPGEYFLP